MPDKKGESKKSEKILGINLSLRQLSWITTVTWKEGKIGLGRTAHCTGKNSSNSLVDMGC